MLSENAIDNLVQPIVLRQESINTYVLESIAKKVREIGTLSPSDIKRLKSLVIFGADIREMNAELARLSNMQVKDIKSVIKTVAIDTHLDAKPLYDYRHKRFIPYEKNEKLQSFVRAVGERTAKSYSNIGKSQATGFLIRDRKNPTKLRLYSISDTYKSVMDEAIQAVSSGVVDYDTAMRKVLKQLINSGIRRASWDSGYTQRLDTTVRRNLLEGVRSIQQQVENEIGREIGSDGIELSAHIRCALDHEPFQGHQFTDLQFDRLQNNQSFRDINGQEFEAVDRIIGQYNCRHIARSIIVGVTKPRYTQEQLDKFIQDNHEGYTLPDGRHITMYECTQMQRQMETRIRYAKDEQMVMQEVGDMNAARVARAKVVRLTQEYNKFSRDCGLAPQKSRTTVPNYKAIKLT